MRYPILIIFSGQPGSGKTTQAKKQAYKRHIAYFDYDTIVQPFLLSIEKEYGIGGSRLSFYSKWRDASYRTLWAPVLENLYMGRDVVLSAPLSLETRDILFFKKMREANGFSCTAVSFYLAPSSGLHYRMLAERASYRDEEIVADYGSYMQSHLPSKPEWDAEYNFFIEFNSYDECDEKVDKGFSLLPL